MTTHTYMNTHHTHEHIHTYTRTHTTHTHAHPHTHTYQHTHNTNTHTYTHTHPPTRHPHTNPHTHTHTHTQTQTHTHTHSNTNTPLIITLTLVPFVRPNCSDVSFTCRPTVSLDVLRLTAVKSANYYQFIGHRPKPQASCNSRRLARDAINGWISLTITVDWQRKVTFYFLLRMICLPENDDWYICPRVGQTFVYN